MGSRKYALLITALVALIAVTAGCQTGPETSVPEETPTADQLREQVISAMEDVETASFTMEMAVETEMATVEMTADGQMDLPAKLMKMNVEADAAGRTIQVTQYIDGSTVYIERDGQWQVRDLSEMPGGGNVWQSNQFTQQQQVLEGGALRLNGTEVIDNRHSYRLEVEVNESVARQLLQQGTVGTGSLENVEITSISFTQFVDVETKQIRRVDMQMEMTVQGQQASADLTMTVSGLNDSVDIQIPEAAKNA